MVKLRRNKNEDDWLQVLKESDLQKKLDRQFRQTFGFKYTVLSFFSLLYGFLFSTVIEQPLIAIAHFIRTSEWTYSLGVVGFVVFIFLIGSFLLLISIISKPIKKAIIQQIDYTRDSFATRLISIVYALMFLDVIIDIIYAISIFAQDFYFYIDLGYLIDKILAGFILLFFIIISIAIYKYFYYRKFND